MSENKDKKKIIEKIREDLLASDPMDYLEELSLPSLELLSRQIDAYNQRIRDEQNPIFSTMAFTTQFLPNFIVAKISQEMLTPYIVGQITNHFKPKEAAKIAMHFRKDYLGEVAIYADKKQVALITQELPFETAFSVMMEMIRKNYFARLGELADLLPPALLIQFLTRLKEKDHLLKIVEHMQNTELIRATLEKIGIH